MDSAFFPISNPAHSDPPTSNPAHSDDEDGVYNYARVFCHYGALLMEFRDAWGEGDSERVTWCWKLFMPHFKSAGHTKYALQALRLHMQVTATLSPNLAHQVMWNRFVNIKGGLGKNIPCDLHNEHVNKLLKHIIVNMGPNLTETALQRAARSVTALNAIAENFDTQSGVPHHSSAHSTKPDIEEGNGHSEKAQATDTSEHRAFPRFERNPLSKWDVEKTKLWIEVNVCTED